MHLVAEPHKNIGGARAALPSGRLRLALLGKLVSCHCLSLIAVFQWFGERRKGKKVVPPKYLFFFTSLFLHVSPLLFQISGIPSAKGIPNQPHCYRRCKRRSKVPIKQNPSKKKTQTTFISIPPSPAPLESRQMEQKSSLPCERKVAQRSQICTLL